MLIVSARQLLDLSATEIIRRSQEDRLDKPTEMCCTLPLVPGALVFWTFDDIVEVRREKYTLGYFIMRRDGDVNSAIIETAFCAAMHERSEMRYGGYNARFSQTCFILEFGKSRLSVATHSNIGVLEFFASKLKYVLDPEIAYRFNLRWAKADLWKKYFSGMIFTRKWVPTEKYLEAINRRGHK